jgi:hypothetical protein
MPITITWPTPTTAEGLIFVPKAETTLVDIGPPERRSYDVNKFRGDIGNLWGSAAGGPYSQPFDHRSEVTISGFTYARSVIILAPYRVQFESGAYVVELEGGNHNISDVLVIDPGNSPAVKVQNSAGLLSTAVPPTAPQIATAVWDETRGVEMLALLGLSPTLVVEHGETYIRVPADGSVLNILVTKVGDTTTLQRL